MIIAVVCGAATGAAADPARAKAANTRGYTLHKQKKYKEAAVEYHKAIAEDPAYLIAHYNLACAAALSGDSLTALNELSWVADRAAWDPDARAAAVKARTDRDFASLRKEGPDLGIVTSDETLGLGLFDLLDNNAVDKVGKILTLPDEDLLAKLAAAPGKHDAQCNNVVIYADLDREGSTTVFGNMRDGVALLDVNRKLVSRAEPNGCDGPGTQLQRLVHTKAVEKGAPAIDAKLLETHLVITTYPTADGYRASVFALTPKHQLVRAFDGIVLSSHGDGSLMLSQVLGTLLHTAPGDKKRHVYRMDTATWKYVEEK